MHRQDNNYIEGRCLVDGVANGALLLTDVALSFWGGVDPVSGDVIDQHHPLKGKNVSGRILAIPSGRGSCTGSSVLLELILNNKAPAALVFSELEEILTLGVIVADVMFNRSLPIIILDKTDFDALNDGFHTHLENGILRQSDMPAIPSPTTVNDAASLHGDPGKVKPLKNTEGPLALTSFDKALLDGKHGKAAQVAMQILTRMANIQGAESLVDITQAHIDGCVYNGPSSLEFAQRLNQWGAKVRIPTTLNSISVDQQRWRQQGIDAAFGEPASQLGDAYMQMGAQMSYTCAPYLLDTAPVKGEQIVWAESNAVTYANSVLGARTQKYADFMDICIALTGRAPNAGSHLDSGRRPTMALTVQAPVSVNDAYWPLLGYHIGLIAVNDIPIVYGLENSTPSTDDLKAFSAAFATSSSAPMFHLSGITPESSMAQEWDKTNLACESKVQVLTTDLLVSWWELNTARSNKVDVICLGNPHFSLSECSSLASLCTGRKKHDDIKIVVTLGRAIYNAAQRAGYIDVLEQFGVEFITDTCWCMLIAPVIPESAQVLMTNSGKYAHYAPGLVGKDIFYDSLAMCVEAACKGQHNSQQPEWLTSPPC